MGIRCFDKKGEVVGWMEMIRLAHLNLQKKSCCFKDEQVEAKLGISSGPSASKGEAFWSEAPFITPAEQEQERLDPTLFSNSAGARASGGLQ